MAEKLEALWMVERYDRMYKGNAFGGSFQYKLFRTRAAARMYAEHHDGKQKGSRYLYGVRRATWGPEQ